MRTQRIAAGLVIAALVGLVFALVRALGQPAVFSPGAIQGGSTASATKIFGVWGGPTNSLDLSVAGLKYTVTSDISVTSFVNSAAAGQENGTVAWFTNSASTNCTLRVTASGVTANDGLVSLVITNGKQRAVAFNKNDLGFHLMTQPFY